MHNSYHTFAKQTRKKLTLLEHNLPCFTRPFTSLTLCCSCCDSLATRRLIEVMWLLHGPGLVHKEDKCCGWFGLVMFSGSSEGEALSPRARGPFGACERQPSVAGVDVSVCRRCPVGCAVLAQQPV